MKEDSSSGYDLSLYVRRFEVFARGFLNGNSKDRTNIEVKIGHSFRVLEETQRITHSLNLDHLSANLVHLAALFHDIGRFPQYARFKTFNDRDSDNHARLGVRTIKRTGALAELTDAHRHLVVGAVSLHNRRFLPPALPSPLDLATRIVRDADKLDIVHVLLNQFSPDVPPNKVITLELAQHPTAYTESILERVRSRGSVGYERLYWVNDLKLVVCSWMYDLNFPISRKLVLERNYLDRLFEYLPHDMEFQDLARQLKEDLLKTMSTDSQGTEEKCLEDNT